ncbi:hypothetical protein [Paenibacillus sp. FSL L8-0708]|uniref:hypothetical protein n=1 Tax=Paenibacillus sp. FSL L8-0708 TaxID=2975311 RepID=UPI0030FC3759
MSQTLIDAVHYLLERDTAFMTLLGLDSAAFPEVKAGKLVKGLEPDIVLSDKNIPQVQIYTMPGRYGRNHLVYEGKFCLDIYAKRSNDARGIAQRAFELFHDKYLSFQGFQSFRCHLAYDTDFATGIKELKGFKAIYDVDYVRK